jgi:hypothetical protein
VPIVTNKDILRRRLGADHGIHRYSSRVGVCAMAGHDRSFADVQEYEPTVWQESAEWTNQDVPKPRSREF